MSMYLNSKTAFKLLTMLYTKRFLLLFSILVLLFSSSCLNKAAREAQKKAETLDTEPTISTPIAGTPRNLGEKPNENGTSGSTETGNTIPDVAGNLKDSLDLIVPVDNLPGSTDQEIRIIPTEFNIAVMLPFSQQYYTPIDSLPKKTKLALEMYEGILVALDRLTAKGLKLNVRVFDTESNESKTRQIIADPILSQMDLIIGPVYNKPLKVVASFTNQYGIPLVSPLSPSTKNTNNNPYYMIASPTVETHCEAMYNYILKNYMGSRVLTLSSNKPKEVHISNSFQQINQTEGPDGNLETPISITPVVYSGYYDKGEDDDEIPHPLEVYLSPMQENVIVLTSFDELFVNNILRQLNLLREKYPITVFGMPNWKDMETLQLEYLTNLNFHLTNTFWVDKANYDYQRFRQEYRAKFYTFPSEYANIGFDLCNYLGTMLSRYGKKFHKDFDIARDEKGVFNEFSFTPSSASKFQSSLNAADYYENKYVNILQFQPDFTFRKLN